MADVNRDAPTPERTGREGGEEGKKGWAAWMHQKGGESVVCGYTRKWKRRERKWTVWRLKGRGKTNKLWGQKQTGKKVKEEEGERGTKGRDWDKQLRGEGAGQNDR